MLANWESRPNAWTKYVNTLLVPDFQRFPSTYIPFGYEQIKVKKFLSFPFSWVGYEIDKPDNTTNDKMISFLPHIHQPRSGITHTK